MLALSVMGPTFVEPAVMDSDLPAGIVKELFTVMELVVLLWAQRATLLAAACSVAVRILMVPEVAQLGADALAIEPFVPVVAMVIAAGSSSQSP
jgi:hypothetical protein